MTTKDSWGGSLHQTFRILPKPAPQLRPFLEADGLTPEEVLARIPYEPARAGDEGTGQPDPKRYRDCKQVFQTAGLLYEGDDKRLHVTELGQAVLRWLDIINERNIVIFGRHAAYALAACQLRNPTGAGRDYAEEFEVFPFSYIWRAMLALEDRITSDELNRALFKVSNEGELHAAIESIRVAREAGTIETMGDETITGARKDDRIIPWMSLASFGWTLINDKRADGADGAYRIPQRTRQLLSEASQLRHRHREFSSTEEYVRVISRSAALPKDLR